MHLDDNGIAIESFLSGHTPFGPEPLYAVGATVDCWRILAFLGRGGSGEVYRAKNLALGILGALKVLNREDAKAKERFHQEARLLSESICPAFPRMYAYGEADGRPYVVTELLEPMELPSGDKAVARFIEKVCAGIAQLHRRGYIHRDIKPSNIMCRPLTGDPVIIDLGLVKASGELPDGRNSTMSIVDGRATGVGTPGYSAPEQFAGGAIVPAADIHALGVLINDCFGGKPRGAWARIVRQSTSSIPEQRYASVDQFAKAIRRRHWAKMLFAGIVLAAAVALCAISLPEISVGARQSVADSGKSRKWIQDTLAVIDKIGKTRSASLNQTDGIINKNVQYASWEGIGETNTVKMVSRWDEVRKKTLKGDVLRTEINLDGRTLKVKDPVVLAGMQEVVISGPGLLDADISGSADVVVRLDRQASFLNRTRIGFPESAIMYTLQRKSYLNFVNLPVPERIDSINVYAASEDDILRFGGPLTYREARAGQFR